MHTREYLDAARRKIGAESNAELARALGLSRAAMTKYYNGERIIDDYTAARLAGLVGIDPLKVIGRVFDSKLLIVSTTILGAMIGVANGGV